MKEILKVFVGMFILSVVFFPLYLPAFAREYTDDTLITALSCIPAAVYGYFFFIEKTLYNKIGDLLGRSLFIKWLSSDGADLFYLYKTREKSSYKLFTSPQKKVCLLFLDAFEQSLKENECNFLHAFTEIKTDIAQQINKSSQIDEQMNSGRSHISIVLNLIEKRSRWKLVSGELHVYRGVLGMGGGEYKALWSYVVKKILDFESLPKEHFFDHERVLNEKIAQAG